MPARSQDSSHGGWYSRFFAAALARGMPRYSAAVEPRKRELLGPLTGRVLEVGSGPGTNLPFLRPEVEWVGLDPNPYSERYLQREAARLGRHVRFVRGSAEDLPFPDASFDAVVCSLVLCSVRDLPRALSEVRRVLRPGGRFVFIEHVAAPRGTGRRFLQRLVRPVWSLCGDGCQPDRETWLAIESAGFSQVELVHFQAPLPLVSPHIAGVALR